MAVRIAGLLVLLLSTTVLSQESKEWNRIKSETAILNRILEASTYDPTERPPKPANSSDESTVVKINLYLRSINKVDDHEMEFGSRVIFRQEWVDERLKFDDMKGKIKFLTVTDSSVIWTPDVFFPNENEGHIHDIIMPNVLLRIYPDGSVLYSTRISMTQSCPMDLRTYPFDQQTCSMLIESYAWQAEDVRFAWKETDPVHISKKVYIPQFTLESYETDDYSVTISTGSYSCLKVSFLFKREFSYYLIHIYIPCCMFVVVSWISFWLDESAVTARAFICVTTLLTMVIHTSGMSEYLPPVPYTKAIDIWTGVCLTFVFAALLEFAFSNYMSRSERHDYTQQNKVELEIGKNGKSDAIEVTSETASDGVRCGSGNGNAPRHSVCQLWLSRFPSKSKRIDVISRILYPAAFGLFNLIYWPVYLL